MSSFPYERIAADLRADIQAGRIPAGGKLPSTRALAARYDVAIETANRALGQLQAEGLIDRRPGVGMFVRQARPLRRVGPHRYARHLWQETTVTGFAYAEGEQAGEQQRGDQTQTVDVVDADDAVAEALGVEPGTPVYQRARLVTREGAPTHTVTSYYRREDVEDTPIIDPRPGMAGAGGSFAVLAERGLEPHEITEELRARMPTSEETQTLQLPPGEPIVELHRTTRTGEGRVIEYAEAVHAASRFIWTYTYPIPD